MKITVFVLIVLSLIVVFSIVLSVLRWQKSQRERKQKMLATLLNRSNRLLDIFQTVSGRYLPGSVKKVLVEYAFSITTQLVKDHYDARAELNHAGLVEVFDNLKLGEKGEVKMRIASQEELTSTQNTLQYLSRMLKKLAENRVIDNGSAKYHMGLLRYTHSLAYCDVLVNQAAQDLDLDKKSRALEKYRTALVALERVSSGGYAQKEIAHLKVMIDDVEKKLFQPTK
ncbi:hypothetical protein [Marinomonas transparens]|uniref:Uncharacterized protein n=1 Tax=Marinomonas transparens TaxID=2795388 RepID=A0A934JSW6_9GAMM|nr:hypothetical protein [Marinomonas transparens]MBJ7536689.1 hypothetical protein [Marinomonas transparens]